MKKIPLLKRFYSKSNINGVVLFVILALVQLGIIILFDHTRLMIKIPATVTIMISWLVFMPIVVEHSKAPDKTGTK